MIRPSSRTSSSCPDTSGLCCSHRPAHRNTERHRCKSTSPAAADASGPIGMRYHMRHHNEMSGTRRYHFPLVRNQSLARHASKVRYHTTPPCIARYHLIATANHLTVPRLCVRVKRQFERKKRRPVGPRGTTGRLTHGYPESGDSLPLFFFLKPPQLMGRGRAFRSSGFHPQAARPRPRGSPARALRSGRVADRPFALHTEAPLRCG